MTALLTQDAACRVSPDEANTSLRSRDRNCCCKPGPALLNLRSPIGPPDRLRNKQRTAESPKVMQNLLKSFSLSFLKDKYMLNVVK